MATYDKLIYNIPPYQQGNVADFEFDLDSNFPVQDVSDISFQLRKAQGKSNQLVFNEKLLSTGGITLQQNTVVILLPASEMKLINGSFYYEIDFINLQNEPFATIGGTFTVNQETNSK